MFFRLLYKAQFFFIGLFLLLFLGITLGLSTEKHTVESESAELIGDPSKELDDVALGGYSISLAKVKEGMRFTNLPAANKLEIRYASLEVGTFNVKVNNRLAHKVDLYSFGALTNSFLNEVMVKSIPAKTTLNTTHEDSDVRLNIGQLKA